MNAPTGSFYHRFASRDLLVAQLRLRIEADFQREVELALQDWQPLRACLCTLQWAREHPNEARLLLLYDRCEFCHGEWPQALMDSVAAAAERAHRSTLAFANLAFGASGPDDIRRARFLLFDLPAAAAVPHVRRREAPPPMLDQLVTICYRTTVAACHSGR